MLRYSIHASIAACLLLAAGQVRAAGELPKVVAEGEWSKPVEDMLAFALRGRLVLCERPMGDRREVAVYVELQDVSEAIGMGMQLYSGDLKCEMRDKDKKIVKSTDYPFGGHVPEAEWVKLPSDATIRLRISPFGVAQEKAMGITPDTGHLWVIPDGDPNEYFLSGTYTIDPADKGLERDHGHIWRGTIDLPAVRIKNQRK